MKAKRETHALPIFRAFLADEIALALLSPGECVPTSLLDATRPHKPLVILLAGDGGDDGRTFVGPEGWGQSRELLRWSRWSLIHVRGAEVWHYQTTVDAARDVGRALIVECGSASLPAWLALRAKVAPYTAMLVARDHVSAPSTRGDGVTS